MENRDFSYDTIWENVVWFNRDCMQKGQSIVITASSNSITESYVYAVRENLFFNGSVGDWGGKVGLVTDTSVRIDLTNASGVEGEFEYFFVVF